MPHDHHHKFNPDNLARLDDPSRRAALPPERLADALGLSPGDRVADVGTGAGYWLFALLDAAPDDVRFWAVDTEPLMLHTLKVRLADHARRDDVTLVQSDEGEVPLDDGVLDVVTMGMVYHELADRRGYLSELARLLAPGGRLAVVDWDLLPPGVERTMGPPEAERVPFAVARDELLAAGFDPITPVPGFAPGVWAVVARRG